MRWVSRIFVGKKELKFLKMDKPIRGIRLVMNDGEVVEGYDNIFKLYASKEVYGICEPDYITFSRVLLISIYDELSIKYEQCFEYCGIVMSREKLFGSRCYKNVSNNGKWFSAVLENVYEPGGSSRVLTGLRIDDNYKDIPVIRVIMGHWSNHFLQDSSEFIYIPRSYREWHKFSMSDSLRTYVAKRAILG